jgi:hypothetical protein
MGRGRFTSLALECWFTLPGTVVFHLIFVRIEADVRLGVLSRISSVPVVSEGCLT